MTERLRAEPAGTTRGEARRNASARRDAAAAVLALQRTVGNHAAGQILARQAAAKQHHQTGLRDDHAIARFVRKAVSFYERNGDLKLTHFARYLGAAVNEELSQIPCPPVNVVINQGALGAAAEFDVGDWQMALNPDEFTHRPEVETIGQLTSDEAGIIAMTVYHEARHAEQHFRLMRLEHGDEGEMSGQELAEAREWQENESGEDATYREAVTSWIFELRDAARLARGVTDDTAEEAHRKIGSALRGWSKSNAAEPYIRSHLASAKQRHKKTEVADITRITADFDRAQAAYDALPPSPQAADFKPLADALVQLYRAVNTAYHDQPVEHDAWDTGGAVFDAFSKRAAAH